jgi:hypothetical protein
MKEKVLTILMQRQVRQFKIHFQNSFVFFNPYGPLLYYRMQQNFVNGLDNTPVETILRIICKPRIQHSTVMKKTYSSLVVLRTMIS